MLVNIYSSKSMSTPNYQATLYDATRERYDSNVVILMSSLNVRSHVHVIYERRHQL